MLSAEVCAQAGPGPRSQQQVPARPACARAPAGQRACQRRAPLAPCRAAAATLEAPQEVAADAEEAAAQPVEEVVQQKLRIKLKSFKNKLLEEAVTIIREAANGTGARAKGAASLPMRKRVYCVLRSPHVNKDSREHFEQRTFTKLVDIFDVNKETLAMLMRIDLPAGVDVQIKL